MKGCVRMLAVLTLLVTATSQADDLAITSFSNGRVTWTYPTNGVQEYRIEWASDLKLGDWTDLEHGLRGLSPTGAVMSAPVPMFYRIKALEPAPANMVYIPAGRFVMGNCMGPTDGDDRELPLHEVYVSTFYIDKYEVTEALWDAVRTWAIANGYEDLPIGSWNEDEEVDYSKGTNHPVHYFSWIEAVKWCNARSQMEGRTPCYYIDPYFYNVYKKDLWVLDNSCVKWSANGYRLPTEAEWEKAARGGTAGNRFPWNDCENIDHRRANYYSDWSGGVPIVAYDMATVEGWHAEPAEREGVLLRQQMPPSSRRVYLRRQQIL